MNERTYHEVLSTVVHELLHPLKSLKPCIDIRFPLRMSGNLTPLKQWNLHRRFKRQCYSPCSLNVCEPKIK